MSAIATGAVFTGLAASGLSIHVNRNFNVNDISGTRLRDDTAFDLTLIGGAAIFVNVIAVIEWITYVMKMNAGKIRTVDSNPRYERLMWWFWSMVMLFYITSIIVGGMDIHMVTDFGNVDVNVSDGKLVGAYAEGLLAMSSVTIAIAGMAFFTYVYAEHGGPKGDSNPRMIMEE